MIKYKDIGPFEIWFLRLKILGVVETLKVLWLKVQGKFNDRPYREDVNENSTNG